MLFPTNRNAYIIKASSKWPTTLRGETLQHRCGCITEAEVSLAGGCLHIWLNVQLITAVEQAFSAAQILYMSPASLLLTGPVLL